MKKAHTYRRKKKGRQYKKKTSNYPPDLEVGVKIHEFLSHFFQGFKGLEFRLKRSYQFASIFEMVVILRFSGSCLVKSMDVWSIRGNHVACWGRYQRNVAGQAWPEIAKVCDTETPRKKT